MVLAGDASDDCPPALGVPVEAASAPPFCRLKHPAIPNSSTAAACNAVRAPTACATRLSPHIST
jgi:hypothetical protein